MKSALLNSSNSFLIVITVCLLSTVSLAQNNNDGDKNYEEKVRTERKTITKEVQLKKDDSKDSEKSETPPNGYSNSGNSNAAGSTLPSDFPKLIDTGNPSADSADYLERKKAWIKNNPAKYKELTAGSTKSSSEVVPSQPLIPTKISQ